MKNITTYLKICSQNHSEIFEKNLKDSNISFIRLENGYLLNDINTENINLILNILSWNILEQIEKNKKNQLIKEGYSSSYVNCINKNPFIAIYIKDKISQYLLNDNNILDTKKFIKYNLINIDNEYYKILNNSFINTSNVVADTLRKVLFKDNKFSNIKELTIDFVDCKNESEFTCNFYTDTGLKITSLSVDSTIKLYGLMIQEKKNDKMIKCELNSIIATILALNPKKVIFKGKYKEKVINFILKSVLKIYINNVEFQII